MDIQAVLWKLYEIGDSSVLNKETRDAAKLVAEVINKVRNIADLGSGEDLVEITAAVHELSKINKSISL